MVGIGNIYACEILFHSRFNPEIKAGSLTVREWARVVESSRFVLLKAI